MEEVLFRSPCRKVLSPGIRVGYLTGPQELLKDLAKMADNTYITPNMISSGIAYEYSQRAWLEPNIDRLKEIYRLGLEALACAFEAYLPKNHNHAWWGFLCRGLLAARAAELSLKD